MLTSDHRKLIRIAQQDASIDIQSILAGLVHDSDHGDEVAEAKLKLFMRQYKATLSPKKAWGAVVLKYNQLEIGDLDEA